MKKYKILLVIMALATSALACRTVMGGGDMPYDAPATSPSGGNGESPTLPPVSTDGGDVTIGGESPFPMTDDASNVVSTPEMVTYLTSLSADEVIKFYQDKFGAMGYTEEKDMTANFGGIFSMTFDGHESGKKIIIAGVPFEEGKTSVTVTFQ